MDQDLDAKVVLPELFAYEKDQTVKANQVLLAMGSEEEKKLDPADKIEEKEEDGTKFLLFHFKAGQDEIKLALKGVKTSTGQLPPVYGPTANEKGRCLLHPQPEPGLGLQGV